QRVTRFVANLFSADSQVLIGIGAIGITCLGPPIFVPVSGVGRVGVGERKVSFCFRVVGGFVREFDFLAVLLLYFLVDVRHIDRHIFVGRGRGEKHEEIVALLRRYF